VVHGFRLIVPLAADGETSLPETATPSSPEKENSPLITGAAGESVGDEPQAMLVRVLFRIVNRKSTSSWPS